MFVGPPGSGKSTFYRTFLSESYYRINNDSLKNPKKAAEVLKAHLSANPDGHNIVIDNTNSNPQQRKVFIEIAEQFKFQSIRCIRFKLPKEECINNNNMRKLESKEHLSKRVASVAIHSIYKNLVEPELHEGFSEIITVKSLPNLNDCDSKELKRAN